MIRSVGKIHFTYTVRLKKNISHEIVLNITYIELLQKKNQKTH